MELQGKIIAIMPSVAGVSQSTGKAWKKQDFIIETMDQYPKKVAFEAWNDDCRQLDDLAQGNVIKVAFNIESREHDSRWYTQLKSWKITVIGK